MNEDLAVRKRPAAYEIVAFVRELIEIKRRNDVLPVACRSRRAQ